MRGKNGLILPVMVCTLLVVGILVGGVLRYVYHGTRQTGMFQAVTRCRLAAQSALEMAKSGVVSAYRAYYVSQNGLMGSNFLNWFSGATSTYVGSGSYSYSAPQNIALAGCTVSVSFVDFDADTRYPQSETITMRAKAECVSANGVHVSKTLEETVRIGIIRSPVFDYAYFVNNHGWFQGGGVTANGDIRANANFDLDTASTVNGHCYAAVNGAMGTQGGGDINIDGGSSVNHQTIEAYWSAQSTRARPTSPTSTGGAEWTQGYDGTSSLNEHQKVLDMPVLGDLSSYIAIAQQQNGTVSQGGKVLIDNRYSGVGPSGLTQLSNGSTAVPDQGTIALIGTQSNPILLNGPVVVDGDVIIKGYVKGQGSIYAGRNIHIVGNIQYVNAPSWSHPDTTPDSTADSNRNKDLLCLAAKGNIVLGDPSSSSWLDNTLKYYIGSSFVNPYTCDPSDASIGYPSTFNGNYNANDGGTMVNRTTQTVGYGRNARQVTTYSAASRKYYQSTVGNLLGDYADTSITRIDATLYNNHAVMGKLGQNCSINGSMVCRDEAIIYSNKLSFNWDIRLGSRSRDGMDIDLYLPMTIGDPQVIGWREVDDEDDA